MDNKKAAIIFAALAFVLLFILETLSHKFPVLIDDVFCDILNYIFTGHMASQVFSTVHDRTSFHINPSTASLVFTFARYRLRSFSDAMIWKNSSLAITDEHFSQQDGLMALLVLKSIMRLDSPNTAYELKGSWTNSIAGKHQSFPAILFFVYL